MGQANNSLSAFPGLEATLGKSTSLFQYLEDLKSLENLNPSLLNHQPKKKKTLNRSTSHLLSNEVCLKCEKPSDGSVILV